METERKVAAHNQRTTGMWDAN